jgi:hypothetical protein
MNRATRRKLRSSCEGLEGRQLLSMMLGQIRPWFAPRADRRRRSVRPVLETLGDRVVPTVMAGDFAGGVYRYEDATGWVNLTTARAYQVSVDSQGDVAVAIENQGVYRYSDATGWAHLTDALPLAGTLGVYDHGFVADFQGQGVYRYDDRTGWAHLTGADASVLKTDDNGDFIAEFPGQGVWEQGIDNYGRDIGWTQANTVDAINVAISQNGQYVAATYPGYGTYRAPNWSGNWEQLTPTVAYALAVNDNDSVAACFSNMGVLRYDDGTRWVSMTSYAASEVHINESGIAVNFDSNGIYQGYSQYDWEPTYSPYGETNFDMR